MFCLSNFNIVVDLVQKVFFAKQLVIIIINIVSIFIMMVRRIDNLLITSLFSSPT